jgi:nucleotide-binding universal stress UspA family protein
MITKLLVAHDGSKPAERAFDFSLDLARRYDAELHVLAVIRPPDLGVEVETEAFIEESRRYYQALLEQLKTRPGGDPARVYFELTIGHPAEQIVLYAERHGIDHIVVGHRGTGLFERWLLGSPARLVIAYAPCAVTVVRG